MLVEFELFSTKKKNACSSLLLLKHRIKEKTKKRTDLPFITHKIMENSTAHIRARIIFEAGLEKVKRSIHQLERIVWQKGEKIGIEKLWASAQLWSVVGFYGVVKTFRDTPVCGLLHAFRAVIHPLNALKAPENYEKYYKRVRTATRGSRRSAGKRALAGEEEGGEKAARDAWEPETILRP